MTPTGAAGQPPTCIRCGVVVECCACERIDCAETICYRCLRIQLRQMLPQPHGHGG